MPRRTLVPLALALAAASLVAGPPARAEDDVPGRLAVTAERVVVFKDGHCLVVKRAVGTSDATGAVFTEEVPDAAVLGCLWATPADGARLLSMVAGTTESETTTTETFACTQFLEILRANVGRPATTVELDDGSIVRGTVREVLVREEAQPVAPSPWMHVSAAPTALGEIRTTTTLTGALFVMTTEEGDSVLPVARVRRVSVKEAKLTAERKVTTKKTSKRLTFRFDGGAAPRTLHLLYFRPGVRWIPTYRVELPESGATSRRARVRLQAEILNEAEDFTDVPFDVVVGVPNFRFKALVSPLVLESAMRDSLREALPQLMGQQMLGGQSNAFANRAGEWRGHAPPGAEGAASLDLPEEITATKTHDLFTYSLPRLTLRKGERAAVPVFDAEVPCRDVYTWAVHVKRKDVEAAPGGAGASPLELSDARVWHQVELVNGTSVPWTTGPAMLLSGSRPLAQELLAYTAPGSAVRVPVTVAIDVRAGFSEEETGRELNAMRWLNQPYARIEKRVRLDVTSSLAEPVDVEVTCDLGGRAVAATHEGKIELNTFRAEDWKDYVGHTAVNHHSTVRFVLRLEPGKTVSPEIGFHYFTRH